MSDTPITATQIKALRERSGMGLLEAKRQLELEALHKQVEHGCTHTELRHVVARLITMLQGPRQ